MSTARCAAGSGRAAVEHHEPRPRGRGHRLALVALLVLLAAGWTALAQRDLPYIHHPDEPTNLHVVDAMVSGGDPNPHFFHYPSLLLYLQAGLHLEGPVLGWLGLEETPPTTLVMGTSRTGSPGSVLLHRGASVALGLVVVAAVFGTTRRLTGRPSAALGAALLMAGSLTLTRNASLVTPDVLATALVAGSVRAAVAVWQSPTPGRHLVAGALVGLAASAKYNAALVAVAVAAAALLTPTTGRSWPSRIALLVASGLAAAAAFLSTTPYAVLDRRAFLEDLRFERQHYASGHPGMDGDSARWYAELLATSETLLLTAALAGVAVALARRQWRPALVVGAFPLAYAPLVASMAVRNERTALLVLPAMAVLAGLGLGLAAQRRGPPRSARKTAALVGTAAVLLLAQGARVAVATGTGPSPWSESRRWVEANVPPGSLVLAEAYSPWIDPHRYRLQTVPSLAAAPGGQDWDVVVASEKMYGRFLDDPDRFPEEVAAYRRTFRGSRELARFTGRGTTIRVLAPVPRSTDPGPAAER